ncbi:hypothetical protein ABZ468_40275 [Streptomyces sp. NPDC005708]|uniref:hypothetical protein n=1 Tax=Streptomyces sp. NPDC005708 TaxID=3154564 RepID=UPI0033C6740D
MAVLVENARTASFYRLDALLELMGPGWGDALGTGAYRKAALAVLQHTGADPHALRRLGPKRLAALLIRHSRGQWREDRAEKIMEAARETLRLWPDGLLDYAELAEDIAAEAQLADHLKLRDTDGREITEAEGRTICATRYKIDKTDRAKTIIRRRSQHLKGTTTSRRDQESLSAPAASSSASHSTNVTRRTPDAAYGPAELLAAWSA